MNIHHSKCRQSKFILTVFTTLFIFYCNIFAENKEALLIANGDYSQFGSLPNPLLDAKILANSLRNIGFNVNLVENASREKMLDAISSFEQRLKESRGIAFFHYGGHGVQVNGYNYLIPVDADIPDEKRVSTRAVQLDEVMNALDASGASVNIVVLDACRDNPLPATSTRSATRGLSIVQAKPKNSIVIYAAEAGSKAQDGLFTPILANALLIPDRQISEVMSDVRRQVYERSKGMQTPGEYNQLFEQIVLASSNDSLPDLKQLPSQLPPPPTNTSLLKQNVSQTIKPPSIDREKTQKTSTRNDSLKNASAQNRMVLLEFTGSDWCPPCQKLAKDVFAQPDFQNFARDNFLTVKKLDFPRRATLTKEQKASNEALAKKYKIEGFPTLILLDGKGAELAREVGYNGGGVKGFIEWFNSNKN